MIKGTGLLWQPSKKEKDFIDEMHWAAGRFQERFGRYPTVCYVGKDTYIPEGITTVAGIRLVRSATVTPGHYFLVIGDEEENGKT